MELKNITGCACGKTHRALLDEYTAEPGAIARLPEYVAKYAGKQGARVFVLADVNTFKAAGERVCGTLAADGVTVARYVFPDEALKPSESAAGSAVMHYDVDCDVIVGVGSGVINDICKILHRISGKPYIIVATAPSMDGYASASSSMECDGVKTSLNTMCANVVVGDLDVLTSAPERMLVAGIGDMLAKYISITEWRISHLVNGEYYCGEVAAMVRAALKKCVDNADGLLRRDGEAVKAVFEGLILSGVAMNYAGISRPASGVEHYFSHVWDMRGLEFGTPVELHGIQCALGTLYAARIYDRLRDLMPDRERALRHARAFDYAAYSETLRRFIGRGAEAMIALEARERKYDLEKHAKRLDRIITHWDDIRAIIDEEAPRAAVIEDLLDRIHAPKSVAEIGIDPSILRQTFCATKDIRDKYVLSSLCWDLGIIDDIEIY